MVMKTDHSNNFRHSPYYKHPSGGRVRLESAIPASLDHILSLFLPHFKLINLFIPTVLYILLSIVTLSISISLWVV